MSAGDCTEPIRIACIGDSITKGTGLAQPGTESYPAQLAVFLEVNGYPNPNVRNFGQDGAGVLNNGYNPFLDTDEYGDALAFDPNVLVVLLGTNDSSKEFWGTDASKLLIARENKLMRALDDGSSDEDEPVVHGELEFEQDLEDLLDIFGRMPADLQILLCTPVPLFDNDGWMSQTVLQGEIGPRIRRVAARRGLRVVELLDSSLMQRPDLFPDGLHPSAVGAAEIAGLVGQVLLDAVGEHEGAAQSFPVDATHVGTVNDVNSFSCRALQIAEDNSVEECCDQSKKKESERQIVMRELQRMRKLQGSQ